MKATNMIDSPKSDAEIPLTRKELDLWLNVLKKRCLLCMPPRRGPSIRAWREREAARESAKIASGAIENDQAI